MLKQNRDRHQDRHQKTAIGGGHGGEVEDDSQGVNKNFVNNSIHKTVLFIK